MKRLATILTACMMLALGECAVMAGSSVSVKELRCEYRVKAAAESPLVRFMGASDGKAAFAVNSGRYRFVSLLNDRVD